MISSQDAVTDVIFGRRYIVFVNRFIFMTSPLLTANGSDGLSFPHKLLCVCYRSVDAGVDRIPESRRALRCPRAMFGVPAVVMVTRRLVCRQIEEF